MSDFQTLFKKCPNYGFPQSYSERVKVGCHFLIVTVLPLFKAGVKGGTQQNEDRSMRGLSLLVIGNLYLYKISRNTQLLALMSVVTNITKSK